MDFARSWIESAERAARSAAALGLAPGTGGNLSVLLDGPAIPPGDPDCLELEAAVPGLAGRVILLTRSGARFRDLHGPRDLGFVRVLADGDRAESWFPDGGVPTFEIDSHLALHAAVRAVGASARAVLHVHPPRLIALTQLHEHRGGEGLERALLGAHPEVAYHLHGGVAHVPYSRSGTASLARRTAERWVTGATAIVWGHHGSLTLGPDLETCLDHAELLDAAASVRLAALAAGRSASGLTPDEIKEMRRLHDTPGRWEEGRET